MANVIIVEDDPVSSDLLQLALLPLRDISVHAFSTAEAARVALASDEQFHAVITDVHLPGEDGLALVAAMRNMPGRSAMPVIIATSSREPEVRRRAEAMGVRAFFEKPWSASRLRDTVNSLVNGI
jgi:CheY-like chemotaxis protein